MESNQNQLYGFWLEVRENDRGERKHHFKGYSTFDIANQARQVKIRKIRQSNALVSRSEVYSYRD